MSCRRPRYVNGDTIYLNYSKVVSISTGEGEAPAKGTFSTRWPRCVKGFVAPSVDTNLWFINPAIFFNGDRVRFVTELQRKRLSKAEMLEDRGQQRLMLDEPSLSGEE